MRSGDLGKQVTGPHLTHNSISPKELIQMICLYASDTFCKSSSKSRTKKSSIGFSINSFLKILKIKIKNL